MNDMNEMTISLKDLFCRILLRWRLMIVSMLIGAVLLGGVGYLKNVKNAPQDTVDADEVLEQTIKKYEDKLSESDLQLVKATMDTYAAYQKNCEFMEEYSKNSIRMKMDANQLPTLRMQYLIDTHYEAVYPVVEAKDMTADIANSYTMKIKDAAVYERIAEELEDGVNAAYVGELISIDTYGDLLIVSVNGLNEADCGKIADVLKKTISQETAGLKKLYGEYDITLVDEAYSEYASASLLSEQRQQIVEYNNQLVAMNGLSSGLTEDQKGYFEALLEAEEEPETIKKEPEKKESASGFQTSFLNKKYIFLGAFAGIFLVCCYVACRYLLSARLRVKEDLEECFGIVNLGVVPTARLKRRTLDCIDRWIISGLGESGGQFSEEERIRMICAGIGIGAKKSGLKSVYLTGVCNDQACEQMKEILCEKLKGKVETVRDGKSVVYDPESLESLVSSDGVVLVERINGSRYDELKKEIEICRQNQIRIIGSVILN